MGSKLDVGHGRGAVRVVQHRDPVERAADAARTLPHTHFGKFGHRRSSMVVVSTPQQQRFMACKMHHATALVTQA